MVIATEGRVLLDVLAVLVDGGGADGLELATGQHRLQDAGGVDRTLGGAGTDEGVDLVDEQDDVAAALDLLEHLLEALLEVTPVARPGHECPEVERVELLVRQGLWDLALDDLLGEALDDGGLADAGLTDEDRVVLGPPREHLHDALDLGVSAHERVELAVLGRLGEVLAELVEHGRAGSGLGRRAAAGGGGRRVLALVARHHLDHLLADPSEVSPERDEDLGGDALALADQAEQHVLGPDVGVAELQRLAQRELEDLLGPRGERRGPRRGVSRHADRLLDLLADGLERDAHGVERLGGHALALVDEAEQDVLGPDEAVVQQPGLFLGQHQHPSGSVGESLEQLPSSAIGLVIRVYRSSVTHESAGRPKCSQQTEASRVNS